MEKQESIFTEQFYRYYCSKLEKQIKKRKIEFNKSLTLSNTKLWNSIKTDSVRKEALNLTAVEAESINLGFQTVWDGIVQPDLQQFIVKDCEKPKHPIFNHDNVGKYLKQLKTSSTGTGNLSPKVLKAARLELTETLTRLFNMNINNSFTPSQFKLANITPIGKVLPLCLYGQ